MLTLARPPPPRHCHASGNLSPVRLNKGSQTRGQHVTIICAFTNVYSPYGSVPTSYDAYGGNRRKYR